MTRTPPWRVLLLDTKRSNPNHYICLAIEQALRGHSEVALVCRSDLGNALRVASDNACNLFFAFDGEELHWGICARLRSVCGLAVLWVTEDPYELPVNQKNASLFDLVFTNDSASVAAYGGRAAHLPFAASVALHHHSVEADESCRYDVFFAGTAWPNRVELVRELSGAFEGLRVKLALSTNAHLPSVALDIAPSAREWRTPNIEFARLANSSRAVLSLHRDFSTSIGAPTAAATPGPRLFEVAMAGGFQLVDGVLPEVARYFRPDHEIVMFSDAADCVRKLRHFLAEPQQRIAIARAAQQRAMAEHTYGHRVAQVLDAAAKLARAQAQGGVPVVTSRPRVLMVTHNLIGGEPWGGVEVYQEWIRTALAESHDIWFYAPVEKTHGKICVLRDGELNEVERFEFKTNADPYLLSSPEREEVFAKLLQRHNFAIVHFQHLLQHVPSLPLIAHALGLPTVLPLHDYYGVCNQFNLIGMYGRFCGVERQGESGCDVCLGAMYDALPGSQARRRSFYRRMLESVTVLHANTHDVRRRYEAVYGTLTRHPGWQIIGVPISASTARTSVSVGWGSEGSRLRVVVPGNFAPHKGAELLVQVFRQLRGAPIQFCILGRVDAQWAQRLRQLEADNLTIHGAYAPEEAEAIMRGADVSLHLSIWPETYCLTLSEAFRAGVVPIVADIGALGERVRHGVNGLKFDLNEPGRLTEMLLDLAHSPVQLEALRAAGSPEDFVDHDSHRRWLLDIYKRLAMLAPSSSAAPVRIDPLTLVDCGVLLNEPIWLERDTARPAPAAPAPAPAAPAAPVHPLDPLPVRALVFLSRHGLRASLRRALGSMRARLRRAQ